MRKQVIHTEFELILELGIHEQLIFMEKVSIEKFYLKTNNATHAISIDQSW